MSNHAVTCADRKAMKGFGCDEKPIVAILSKRCIKQRVQIADCYKREFGRVRVPASQQRC